MANVNKYYKTAFAENGSRLDVPDESVSGVVAFNSGYGSDYELPQGDPLRKRIERDKFNDLIYGITKNIKQNQEFSFPTWIEDRGDGSPFFYSTGAIVYHQSTYYVSNEDLNDGIPGADSRWTELDFINISNLVEQATETKAGVAEIATQAEVDAGVDDEKIVTAKKLKANKNKSLLSQTKDFSLVANVGSVEHIGIRSASLRYIEADDGFVIGGEIQINFNSFSVPTDDGFVCDFYIPDLAKEYFGVEKMFSSACGTAVVEPAFTDRDYTPTAAKIITGPTHDSFRVTVGELLGSSADAVAGDPQECNTILMYFSVSCTGKVKV